MNWTLRCSVLGSRNCIRSWIRRIQTQCHARNVKYNKSSGSEIPVRKGSALLVAAHAGSGFCRAALICSKGKLLKLSMLPCRVYKNGIFSEMSSENIWTNLVRCIKKINEGMDHENVRGIGFTAIPAMVCLQENGSPVTASISKDPNINIILHYDKRSTLEAERITKTHHELLQYFGERILPDLQDTKLIWIKHNLKEDCWDKAGHFLDLTDFLTWKATGSFVRSSSTLVSQWSYEIAANGKEGWNAEYFKEIGLDELAENNFKKLGSDIQRPGYPVPEGLLEEVAKDMGLKSKLPVATGMPDAMAGNLGLVGCNVKGVADDIPNRLCIVFGTRAASHSILSRDPYFVKGVKGPFRDSVLPNMWLNLAGQTTAESVLEYIVETHPAAPELKKQIGPMHIHKHLNKILKMKAQKMKGKSIPFLTKYLHVLPDFDGNISPIGDPRIRGMISGLSTSYSQDSLALLYLSTIQSLAYSTKHIISTLTQQGHDIRCILIGGGLAKNSLFAKLQKDVCQLPTVIPDESDSKLIGAAILAGIASNTFRDFNHAMQEMCGVGQIMLPKKDLDILRYHEKKYQVFLKMYDHQMEYRRIMSGESEDAPHMEPSK